MSTFKSSLFNDAVNKAKKMKGETTLSEPVVIVPNDSSYFTLQTYLTSECEFPWPLGLQQILINDFDFVPYRYVSLDDSGSMRKRGSCLQKISNTSFSYITTTRWKELGKFVNFFVDLVVKSPTSTEFKYLNRPDKIILTPEKHNHEASLVKAILTGEPDGGTPLIADIESIIEDLKNKATELRRNSQRACIIIATDGIPSNPNGMDATPADVLKAMDPLKNLPCFVVLRLCTDDARVIDFWNNIDADLEVEIDVLDDFVSEAKEVFHHNPWLTYGEPLHQLREFGVTLKEIDTVDEKALKGDNLKNLIHAILGGDIREYPSYTDLEQFKKFVAEKQKNLPLVYDCISNTMQPWIKIQALFE